MPFQCKCGRTFEQPETFSGHSASCVVFHHQRRKSDAVVAATSPSSAETLPSSSPSFFRLLSGERQQQQQQQQQSANNSRMEQNVDINSSAIPAFMPASLSLDQTFENVRRRSSSQSGCSEHEDKE
ncbi:hypothetical protein VTP01DRAFT_7654 [Rhizomucor pusillus]|uniref:uncharacterized protein n=1 Tax=Rhizomucor pusillus TaxID=4840 RepID=UPI0037436967